jgi:hypothetical protein
MQVVNSLEQFWINVNRNRVSFSDKKDLDQKVISMMAAMQKLNGYKFKSFEFDNVLKCDLIAEKATIKRKTPLEWATREEEKLKDIIEQDKRETEKLIADLDGKIKDISTYLGAS